MAILQTVNQTLAAEQADNINGLSAQRLFAAATIAAVGQGLIEGNGRGITEKFTSSADVLASAEIIVRRIKPFKLNPRELGRARNGGAYAPDLGHYSESENVSIKTLGIITDLIKIPMVSQSMIPVDLASQELANFVIGEANVLNGMTYAEKFFATYGLAEAKKNEIVINTSTDNLAIKMIDARTKLFKGDAEHGFYTFPDNGQVYVLHSDWYSLFYSKGVLVLNNGIVSEAGQKMVAEGGISPNARETIRENGFVGFINNIPVHLITPYVINIAEDFLGLPYGELYDGHYMGYLSSEVGTGRGVSTQENFKVVDDPNGQGIIIQPLVKYGCKTFYQKANCHLVDGSFVNPYAGLKALWSSGVEWQVLGAGSRLFPVITCSAISTLAFTTKCEVYADADISKSVNLANTKIYWVEGDEAKETFKDFYAAYTANGANKGDCTSGTQKGSLTLTSGKYVTFCAVSVDGSVSLKGVEVPA